MNENDEWKKEESNEPRSSKYLRISRDLIRLGFDSTSAWNVSLWNDFQKTRCAHKMLLYFFELSYKRVSAAPRERKLLHKEKKKRINQNVQLVPRGSERSGLIKIRNCGPSRSWLTWNQITDKTGYLILLSGFTNCQLIFLFNTQISLGTDIQWNEAATNKDWGLSLSNTRRVICLS